MVGMALRPSPFYLLCIPIHSKTLTITATFLWTEWQEVWGTGEQQLGRDAEGMNPQNVLLYPQGSELSMPLYHTDTSNLCIALHGVPIITPRLPGNSTEHTAMPVTPQACFKVTDDCSLCFLDNGISCLHIECWQGEEKAWRCKLEHVKCGNFFFGTVFLIQRIKVIYQSKSIHSQWSEIENIHKETPSSEMRLWKCYEMA